MKVTYDAQADAVYFRLADDGIVNSDQVEPGVILDYDAKGQVVGVEILWVKDRVPRSMLTHMDFSVSEAEGGQ